MSMMIFVSFLISVVVFLALFYVFRSVPRCYTTDIFTLRIYAGRRTLFVLPNKNSKYKGEFSFAETFGRKVPNFGKAFVTSDRTILRAANDLFEREGCRTVQRGLYDFSADRYDLSHLTEDDFADFYKLVQKRYSSNVGRRKKITLNKERNALSEELYSEIEKRENSANNNQISDEI